MPCLRTLKDALDATVHYYSDAASMQVSVIRSTGMFGKICPILKTKREQKIPQI